MNENNDTNEKKESSRYASNSSSIESVVSKENDVEDSNVQVENNGKEGNQGNDQKTESVEGGEEGGKSGKEGKEGKDGGKKSGKKKSDEQQQETSDEQENNLEKNKATMQQNKPETNGKDGEGSSKETNRKQGKGKKENGDVQNKQNQYEMKIKALEEKVASLEKGAWKSAVAERVNEIRESLNPVLIPVVDVLNNEEKVVSALMELNEQIKELFSEKGSQKKKFDEFKKKVDQWKKSVKEISLKDKSKLQSLRKECNQQKARLSELENEISTKNSPKNQEYDILATVEIDNDLWSFIHYDLQSLGNQWILSTKLNSRPESIQEKMKSEHLKTTKSLEQQINELLQKTSKTEKDFEMYKVKAQQALQRKDERLKTLEIGKEKEIMKFQEQVQELSEDVVNIQHEADRLREDKKKLDEELLGFESLKRLYAEKSTSLNEVMESTKNIRLKYESLLAEKADLQKEYDMSFEKHQEQLARTTETYELQIDDMSQRHRKLLNGKESQISKLKSQVKSMKKQIQDLEDAQLASPVQPESIDKEVQILRNIVGTPNSESDRFSQLAQIQAQRKDEIQDKENHIAILKASLAQKSQEVESLRDVENQLKIQLQYAEHYQNKGIPNMEFFKNVFMKFFEADETIKHTSLKTMAQILNLTNEEVETIEKKLKNNGGLSGWSFGFR